MIRLLIHLHVTCKSNNIMRLFYIKNIATHLGFQVDWQLVATGVERVCLERARVNVLELFTNHTLLSIWKYISIHRCMSKVIVGKLKIFFSAQFQSDLTRSSIPIEYNWIYKLLFNILTCDGH